MKTIYKSKYVILSFDDSRKLFISKWLPESEEMQEMELRSEFINAAKLVEEYKPKFYLSDNTHQRFSFSVDIQNWVATTIVTPCIKVGIKKFAIIMPIEIIAQLSTEQAVDEASKLPIEIKYFNNETTAFEWFGF